jgi:hypothetical protein
MTAAGATQHGFFKGYIYTPARALTPLLLDASVEQSLPLPPEPRASFWLKPGAKIADAGSRRALREDGAQPTVKYARHCQSAGSGDPSIRTHSIDLSSSAASTSSCTPGSRHSSRDAGKSISFLAVVGRSRAASACSRSPSFAWALAARTPAYPLFEVSPFCAASSPSLSASARRAP